MKAQMFSIQLIYVSISSDINALNVVLLQVLLVRTKLLLTHVAMAMLQR